MNNIAIIGNGNVGYHLHRAFSRVGVSVTLYGAREFRGFDYPPELILLTVKDDAIAGMSARIAAVLPAFDGIVAHTSGSVSINVLQRFFPFCGVFYPLQTFSKSNLDIDYSHIPFFVEGSDQRVTAMLEEMARRLSGDVFMLDSDHRMKMHIASVFACNFTNALFGMAEEILRDASVPFSVMLPLISQTVKKLDTMLPSEAQTGPAVRGDSKIVGKHIDALKPNTELQQLYRLLSKYINPKI